ncbi:MAG: YihY/virulence factor BrkB family protein [Mangrovicoccus sp.]
MKKLALAIWRSIRGMLSRIDEANLSLVAAGGAFFTMLSLFPAIGAMVTLLGIVADPQLVQEQISLIQGFVPAEAFDIIQTQSARMVEANNTALGWATAISLAATLWSARKGTDALIKAINAVYHCPSHNGAYAAALSLILTTAMILVGVIALLAMVVVPLITSILTLDLVVKYVPAEILSFATSFMLEGLRWGIAFVVIALGIWVLYRLSPNRRKDNLVALWPGVLMAMGVWCVACWGFTYYLGHFGNYSKVYGSIAAVIALLMFLYITIFTVLLGATLNAELEARRIEAAKETA